MSREDKEFITKLFGGILGICLVPIGAIVGIALLVSFACAFFGAFIGMFIHDEGFFTLFGSIFAHISRKMLFLDQVGEFLSETLGVLKWAGLGVAGVCVALPALCFVGGLLACCLWVYWAELLSRKGSEERGPVVDGVRVGYFHWTGMWLRRVKGASHRTLEHFDSCPSRMAAPFVWPFAIGGWVGCALNSWLQLIVRLAVVLLLWVPRVVVAAWLRWWVGAMRTVRECSDCHNWTTAPVWRCPKCGWAHRRIAPSAKFGLLWWRCECGARLPTLGVLGRRALAEECPGCGGGLTGVGVAPAGVAFLGVKDAGLTRLAQEVASADAGSRQLRTYAAEAQSAEEADFTGQRQWGHVGVVVFGVRPSDLHEADLVWSLWRIFMDREYPRRGRRMSCAVLLGRSERSSLPRGAGDAECRSYLSSLGIGGNLLNGLDRTFLRVRLFPGQAGGEEAEGEAREWVVREALRAPLAAGAHPPGLAGRLLHGWRMLAVHLLVLAGLAAWGWGGWMERSEAVRLRGRVAELQARAGEWEASSRGVKVSDWSRMEEAREDLGKAYLAEDSEGNRLRGQREALADEERKKAAEALAALKACGRGDGGAGAGWRRLRTDVQAAGKRLEMAAEENKSDLQELREAEDGFEELLAVGETVLARHAEWHAAERRLAEAEEAETRYWRAVQALQRMASDEVAGAGEAFPVDLGGGVKLEMVHCPGVASDFWMGKTEVTQEQWQRVMGENPSHFAGKPKNPVENVSWNDCTNFVAKLNALPAARASGLTFRLPTEEEWETACRAGAPKSSDYCKLADGTQITAATLYKVARYDKGWDDGPVAGESSLPNAWGLNDMHGNVWEWTQTAVGVLRVCRGGSFCGTAEYCSAGHRYRSRPDYAGRFFGLRLAASGRAAGR